MVTTSEVPPNKFDTMAVEDFDRVFAVNVRGTFLVVKHACRLLKSMPEANIVNTASIVGLRPGPQPLPYSSSKAAIISLTECLAVELKEKNISVNCVAFGSVQTEMFGEAFPSFKAGLSTVDAAKYLVDFCLNGHKYFNGKVLEVSTSTP